MELDPVETNPTLFRCAGENIGDTPTHVIFVDLKERPAAAEEAGGPGLGPTER